MAFRPMGITIDIRIRVKHILYIVERRTNMG